ncbi:MAG: hypothetical protein HDT32_06435 [Clostridiales bacterium]|nr:hypothetical protein [Clostridiales bacterium]
MEKLIVENKARTFIFGAMDGFDYMGYSAVTVQRAENYPRLKRFYISQIPEELIESKKIFIENFEKFKFPFKDLNAGNQRFFKRNELIVDACDILVTYYNKEHPEMETKKAYDYAVANGKKIINLFDEQEAKYLKF